MANPNREPKRLKQVKGTLRADRRPKNELELPSINSLPQPPEHLSESACKVFNHVVEVLYNRGVIADLDLYALSMLASNVAMVIKAEKMLQERGYLETITNKGGGTYEVKSPWISIRNEAEKNFVTLAGKFGLTPSDRAKISMPEPKKKDPFEEL